MKTLTSSVFAALAIACAAHAKLGDTFTQSRDHYGDPFSMEAVPGKTDEFYAVYEVKRYGEDLVIQEWYLDYKAVSIVYYWPETHDDFTPDQIADFVAENLPADLRDQSSWKVGFKSKTSVESTVGDYRINRDSNHFEISKKNK
jgi:hypothetical protein